MPGARDERRLPDLFTLFIAFAIRAGKLQRAVLALFSAARFFSRFSVLFFDCHARRVSDLFSLEGRR